MVPSDTAVIRTGTVHVVRRSAVALLESISHGCSSLVVAPAIVVPSPRFGLLELAQVRVELLLLLSGWLAWLARIGLTDLGVVVCEQKRRSHRLCIVEPYTRVGASRP